MLHQASLICECPGHTADSVERVINPVAEENIRQLNQRLAHLLDECTDGKILHLLPDWKSESDDEERAKGVLTLLEKTMLLNAEEAVKYGLADHIIDEEKFRDLFFR